MTSVCLVADCLKSYDKYREINILMRLGPTLTGDKPMHILCFNKNFKFINETLNDVHLLFSESKTIRYQLVYSTNESIKIIFYNINKMDKLLADHRVRRFLQNHGYTPLAGPEDYMSILADHLKHNRLPAEFGVFFGYPLKDVMGFIGHPSLKHVKTTAWKVYGDPRLSDQILSKFEAAEKKVLDLCQTLPIPQALLMLDSAS